VGRRDVQLELLDQAGETRRLALGQLENEPRKSRGVDDRMLQRAFQPATDEPGVEGVVAVLDQDGPLGKTEERPAGVTKLGRADQHRPVDVVPLLGVGIYGRAAIDEGIEERKWA
jgi:hypothetical protein